MGVAHLETDELIFRGEFKLTIPYATIANASAAMGRLTITFDGGNAVFELGEETADHWAEQIPATASEVDEQDASS